ncbi:hypothetical protein H0H93_009342 [Arthromyces matolae]|nr:hypothetical protein H0H93_009342 [Arthromyces matolae]
MVQQIIIMGSADQLLEDELSRFLDVFNSRDSVDGAFRLVKPFHPFLQDYLVRVKRERERRRAQTLSLLSQKKTPTQALPRKEAPCENALGVEDSPSDKEGWERKASSRQPRATVSSSPPPNFASSNRFSALPIDSVPNSDPSSLSSPSPPIPPERNGKDDWITQNLTKMLSLIKSRGR